MIAAAGAAVAAVPREWPMGPPLAHTCYAAGAIMLVGALFFIRRRSGRFHHVYADLFVFLCGGAAVAAFITALVFKRRPAVLPLMAAGLALFLCAGMAGARKRGM
ncbi:MAG: hypothetical protein ABIF71_07485 [Planctomycetota bacterium]